MQAISPIQASSLGGGTVRDLMCSEYFPLKELKDPKLMSPLEKIEYALEKICETDEMGIPDRPPISQENEKVLEFTEKNAVYKENRFHVKLPFNDKRNQLHNNFFTERNRIYSIVSKLKKDPRKFQLYSQQIKDMLAKGYIELVKDRYPELGLKFYLQHLGVWKEDRETTKLRIVFNGALKLKNGLSINSCLYAGPDLQPKLLTILLKFRFGKFCFIADCSEYYPQTCLFEEDRDSVRFLFVDERQNIQVYRHKRLLFGLNCAPFLAMWCSLKAAQMHAEKCPKGYQTIVHDRYMDDCPSSQESKELCIQAISETQEIMGHIGVKLHKVVSNSDEVLASVDPELRLKEWVPGQPKPCSSVLGILWNSEEDFFQLQPAKVTEHSDTKRGVLSLIHAHFDPVGFLCCFFIVGKMLLQQMWSKKIEWDEKLPIEIHTEVVKWTEQLPKIKDIKIPRRPVPGQMTELHCFTDSSLKAYAAMFYVCDSDGNCGLVFGKSRLHSLKPGRTIPQKELIAATLGAQLVPEVEKAFPGLKLFMWTDSMNVLSWVQTDDPCRYIQYIHNRIGQIRQFTDVSCWNHVRSGDNPADLPSRGCLNLDDLKDNKLYWNGPTFLRDPKVPYPKKVQCARLDLNVKKQFQKPQIEQVMVNFVRLDLPDLEQFETLPELKQEIVKRNKVKENDDSPVSVLDLERAENELIHDSQVEAFPKEMNALEAGQPIPAKSSIVKFHPALDDKNVMRSNSRLVNAELLSDEQKYPIILPKNHTVTVLIIKDIHAKSHCSYGMNWTLDEFMKRFTVKSARQQVKKVLRKCRGCKIHFGKCKPPIMAPILSVRLKNSMAVFISTACDFAGPIVTVIGRGRKRQKRYLCIFTCMEVRAVHIEVAYSLETDDFLMCLGNFLARRGNVKRIYCDNGSNFKGAQRELRGLLQQLEESELQQHAAERGIEFHFNPPYAPHFGGIHESMVKSCKRALFSVLKNREFSDAMLIAAATGAEDIVNSRPLGYQSNNPTDFRALTPNMFLHGRLDGFSFPPNIDRTDFDIRKRWRHVQDALRHVWRRFLREIIPTLGIRQKWTNDGRNFQVNDEVLIIDPNAPRYRWNIGRVSNVYPGRDGVVRVCDVQTEHGELMQRSVHRLIPLT